MANFLKEINGIARSAAVQGTDIASGAASSTQFLAANGSAGSAFRSLVNTDISGLTNTQLSGSAAISNANLANMAGHTFKANFSSSSSIPGDLNLSQVQSLLNLTTSVSGTGNTTTLTSANTTVQRFTGTSQTVVLPDATTLAVNSIFIIENRGSNALTIKLNDTTTTLTTVAVGDQVVVNVLTIGTSNGTWDVTANIAISALTGDVTASGPGSAVATIAANAVTNAKLATMSAFTAKANITGSTATPTDVALAVSSSNNTIMLRDGNANVGANNFTFNYSSTVTAGTTTTLAVGSSYNQYFTGSTTQTVKLPDATTLPGTGYALRIVNLSSGSLSVVDNSSGAVQTMAANTFAIITAKSLATAAGSWDSQYSGSSGITALTGDVTASGSGSVAATIAANAVTNAKLATMGANTVKANVTGGSAVPTDVAIVSAPTASAAMVRDANANVRTNNHISNFTTTATAAGTTTLTVSSSHTQQFTGSTTQTVVLPDATTLPQTGFQFLITNRSTGVVTVNKNGGTLLYAIPANGQAFVTVTDISTSAGTWDTAASTVGAIVSVAPTVQKFTTGSGTYTTPSNPAPIYIRVRMVGGGGGGGGSGSSASGTNTGGTGGNTTFGTTLLVANGGTGGTNSAVGSAGTGGTASLGSGPIGTALTGGSGVLAANINASLTFQEGGAGGNAAFGGGGSSAGVTNTGSGGNGGAASGTGVNTAHGGGAGGFVDAIISGATLTSTFSYSVGASGAAGTAATNGAAGGAGGSGYIEVTEYYANAAVGLADRAVVSTNPTVQRFTSSSGTYTTPSGVAYIKIKMIGGGGGGSGSGTANTGGAGSGGGDTTWSVHSGSAIVTSAKGLGGGQPQGAPSGTGGTNTFNSPAIVVVNAPGGNGNQANPQGATNAPSGSGGSGAYGGAGQAINANVSVGQAAGANTGAGGGGAPFTTNSAGNPGTGGGSGAYSEFILTTPSASYDYAVGGGGNGGSAGTSGFIGGAGGSGVIVVEEYYTVQSVGTLTTAGPSTYIGGPQNGTTGTVALNTFKSPTTTTLTSTGSQTGWLFTISTTSTVAVGDTYTNNSNTYTVLGALTAQSGQVLWMSGTGATSGSTLTRATGSGTSSITFSAKSAIATYTPPAGSLYLEIEGVGGGSGGSGAQTGATSPATSTAGGLTAFGPNLFLLQGGTGAPGASQANNGPAGGTGTLNPGGNTIAQGLVFTGGDGSTTDHLAGGTTTKYMFGGTGGASMFGGGASGGANAAGLNAGAYGAGGGGGGTPNITTTDGQGGNGGAAGAGAKVTIPGTLSANYYYCIGTGGGGGGGAGSGFAGGSGQSGVMIIKEKYQ